MARMFAFPRAACSAAAGAAVVLIASHNAAKSQAVDPGWQLVYAGQPEYGDRLMESMFGDSSGQPIVARAFQPPEPLYSETDQAAQPSTQESAPAAAQQPAAAASTQHVRSRRPAPAYYQLVPAQQARGAGQGPVYYYRQAPAQSSLPQPAPASGGQAVPQPQVAAQPPVLRHAATVSPVQARTVQSPSAGYRMAAAPQAQPDPPYAGSVVAQQVRSTQPAPANYQVGAAPRQQSSQEYTGPAPAQQPRGLFSANYQLAAASQAGNYPPPGQYQQQSARQQLAFGYTTQPQQGYSYQAPGYAPSTYGDMAAQQALDPRYQRQVVEYRGAEKPGTIIVDTPHFFLYLLMDGGRALRYGIGVGRPGFTWAGVKSVSAKREWPDWRPPDEMLARRPDLPHYMPGGPENPLGARALYLGSTLYRIHGSNEPWSIGTQVSSGCIRLRNEDIIDLYGRVKVGAKVIVI